VDDEGNVYVTGFSDVAGRGYATIKYDAMGIQQWVALYFGPENGSNEAKALALDLDGNVYVTGHSYGGLTHDDYATIKYNSAGQQLWAVRYTGPENYDDVAIDLAIDGDGNVIVTGYSGISPDSYDYLTIKYNSAGDTIWTRRYDGLVNGSNYANGLAIDINGNVYVTGGSPGMGSYTDYATIKYNTDGEEKWVARYNGPGNGWDWALAVSVDSAENVFVTGSSYGGSLSAYDYATIKYDSAGEQQWEARYTMPEYGEDEGTDLVLSGDGGVYVTGFSDGAGTGDDYATMKYDANGRLQWVRRYNGLHDFDDKAVSLHADSDGGVYVTGRSCDQFGDEYATVKYNSNGVQQWVARYNGPAHSDIATGLDLDTYGNVYVTGLSLGASQTNYDFATIKYSQPAVPNWQQVEAVPFGAPLPQECRLEAPSPNPFNPTTALSFKLQAASQVRLTIYDTAGRLVTTLVNGWREAGTHEVTFDGSSLASGMYLVKMHAGEFAAVQKIVLMK
jgi:uncharacterized delta-60 repeat protein